MRYESNGDYLAGKIDAERYVERHGTLAAETRADAMRDGIAYGRSEDSPAYVAGFTFKVRQFARRQTREDV